MAVLDYRIRYRQDVGAWQEVLPQKEIVILGRGKDADIVLESSKVSRHHAQIEFTATGIFLTDLGSTNGTLVGGGGNGRSYAQLCEMPENYICNSTKFD